MTAPSMKPVNLDALPDLLKDAPIWRNWRRGAGNSKLPVDASNDNGGRHNGHVLETAMSFEAAARYIGSRYGLGLTTGYAPIPMVAIDVDEKEGLFHGARVTAEMAVRVPRLAPMIGMPYLMAAVVIESLDAGGFAERSVGGRGAHAFLGGTAPQGHPTRWKFERDHAMYNLAQMFAIAGTTVTHGLLEEEFAKYDKAVEGEIYSETRWLTVTGDHLHPADTDTAALMLAPCDYSQEIIDRTLGWCSTRSHKALPGTVDIDATLRAEYIAPDALTGALSVFKSEKLVPLWTGELRGDSSRLDYRLCNTLFEVLGDDPVAVNAAFLSSGRVRAKWGKIHVRGQTYGAATIASARQNWLDGGCRTLRPFTPAAAARPAIDWPAEARERLIFGALAQAKGNSAAKQSNRRILGALFDHIDKGECHVHQGRIYVHTGGIRAMEQSMSAGSTDIKRRLTWMPGAGIIAQFSQDENGRPQVVMHASHLDCPALLEGLQPGYDVIPARPQTDRKPRAAVAAPKARAPRAHLPKSLQRAEWSMWLLMGGRRDVDTIAEMSGQSARAVKKHVADLQDMNLLTSDLTPVVTHTEYRSLVADERALCWQITRERREAETAEYRRLCALRGAKNPSLARLAQRAAEDVDAEMYLNAAD